MKWFFLFFLALPQILFAQLVDDFSSGQLNQNPIWTGQPDSFLITNTGRLQLNAYKQASESWLFAPSNAIEDATWEMDIEMAFDPSTQNHCRIYLAADQDVPALIKNAYYVSVGASNDDISLYKITNGNAICLIDGENNRLSLSKVLVTIRVSYSHEQGWLLQSKCGNDWITEGESKDQPDFSASYFGIFCKYSATRSKLFYFDNIDVKGTPLKDRTAPVLLESELSNRKQMNLTFSETVTTSTASVIMQTDAYSGQISLSNLGSQAIIAFDNNLPDQFSDTLVVRGIEDLFGNVMPDVKIPIQYQTRKMIEFKIFENSIQFKFSKPMSTGNIIPDMFQLSPASPVIQRCEWIDPITMNIVFATPFQNKTVYQLHGESLTDAMGDMADPFVVKFDCFKPERGDVVFTEFMPDPEPAVDMPENEFIELHNRTLFDAKLLGWNLQYNGRNYPLPDTMLPALGFITLMHADDAPEWPCSVAKMKNFPSMTNTSGEIVLFSSDRVVMDALRYDDQWQNGTFKDDGGWSFEIIDVDNRCGQFSNWAYSVSEKGGTPGNINSVASINKDEIAPYVTHITLTDNHIVDLFFSEPMQLFDIIEQPRLITEPDLTINHIDADTIFMNRLTIDYATPFDVNHTYQIQSINWVDDLSGNPMVDWFPLRFTQSKTPEAGDIIFNEILFNPISEDVDFIELVNVTNKALLMNHLYLTAMKGDTSIQLIRLSDKAIPMLPNEHWVLTPDSAKTLKHHNCVIPYRVLETHSFPSMPDDGGAIAITDKQGILIDRITYSEKWHFPLLKQREGVSLERISPLKATQDASNWHSASSLSGYTTPTTQNSQWRNTTQTTPGLTMTLDPELFTPDMDGQNDLLLIGLGENATGGVLTLKIYNPAGNVTKELANNVMTGNNDCFTWDGTNQLGERLHPGMYIVWGRICFPDGRIEEVRKSCVLGITPR